MKNILAIILIAISLTAFAKQPQDNYYVKPNEAQLTEHNHYINKSGNEVHSPAHSVNGGAPNGASAKCRDGTYSFSQHRSGTCSHHGGVGEWLN